MQLKDLCKGVYPSSPQLKSQHKFIEALFSAAGDVPYFSQSNGKQLFSGRKHFNNNLKISMRGKDNISSLIAFFEENISSDRVGTVIAAFGIPESGEPNIKALATALTMQTRAIIESTVDETDDIILMEYQRAKSNHGAETKTGTRLLTPLYPGDSGWSEFKPHQTYKANCYEKIAHTWVIHNTGSQSWNGRKLVLVNQDELSIIADNSSIIIPDTPTGGIVKVTANIDTRGFEGRFDLKWEMQDSDGNCCFPNDKRMLYIHLQIVFE